MPHGRGRFQLWLGAISRSVHNASSPTPRRHQLVLAAALADWASAAPLISSASDGQPRRRAGERRADHAVAWRATTAGARTYQPRPGIPPTRRSQSARAGWRWGRRRRGGPGRSGHPATIRDQPPRPGQHHLVHPLFGSRRRYRAAAIRERCCRFGSLAICGQLAQRPHGQRVETNHLRPDQRRGFDAKGKAPNMIGVLCGASAARASASFGNAVCTPSAMTAPPPASTNEGSRVTWAGTGGGGP